MKEIDPKPICGLCGKEMYRSSYNDYSCLECYYYLTPYITTCPHCLNKLLIIPKETGTIEKPAVNSRYLIICSNPACPNKIAYDTSKETHVVYDNGAIITFNSTIGKGLLIKHGFITLKFEINSPIYKTLNL